MTFLPFRLARAVLAGIGTTYETLIPGPSIHGYRLDAAEMLAEAEAEQEVSEPRITSCMHTFDPWCAVCVLRARSRIDWLKTSAATPPAAVDDPAGGAPASAPQPSAGSPSVPAGVSARPKTVAPSAGRTTAGQFAAVAVREVLAAPLAVGRGHIRLEDARTDDWSADDWHDWREHVSAEVRRRIDAANTPPLFETGLDMGVSVASEFFPQSHSSEKCTCDGLYGSAVGRCLKHCKT